MGNSNNRPQSKVLQRQDTMPEYPAPALPVDNYGKIGSSLTKHSVYGTLRVNNDIVFRGR